MISSHLEPFHNLTVYFLKSQSDAKYAYRLLVIETGAYEISSQNSGHFLFPIWPMCCVTITILGTSENDICTHFK